MKSDELSTINAELKKLGISGGRGELTQAGRDLEIQEVRKRRVDVRQGTSLFTVKEVSQSHGFAFNFGLRKNCPTLSRNGLSSFPQSSGRGKESKKGSGEDVPGLMDESSSDGETSPSTSFTNLKIQTGVNKKPKKFKTVWHGFRGILKLSGRVNQASLKLSAGFSNTVC